MTALLPLLRLQLWCPDTRPNTGGIQRFSSYLERAARGSASVSAVSVVLKDGLSDRSLRTRGCGQWKASWRPGAFACAVTLASAREKPGLIISTHLNYGPVARALRRLTRVPYWLIAHGIDAWKVVGKSRCDGIRAADRVLCVSEFTRQKLLAQGLVTETNSPVFPNTFDQERFSPGPKPAHLLERYGLTPENPVILTVGRLSATERYKGFDELIEAMPGIRSAIPSARLVVVGDGNARRGLEEKARDLGLEKSVTFTGAVGDAELVDHYRLSDLFAMPSRKEGFGIVFLEALAVGKPVIAGNVDASPEAVLNGELGALVDPADPRQITAAAIAILQREHGNQRLYDPAYLRQRAVEAFGFEAFKQRLDLLLSQQLSSVSA